MIRRWKAKDWFELFVGIVTIIFLFASIIYGGARAFTNLRTERACLERGYKSAKVDVFLTPYCIKRVDQTDVVVPLSKAR